MDKFEYLVLYASGYNKKLYVSTCPKGEEETRWYKLLNEKKLSLHEDLGFLGDVGWELVNYLISPGSYNWIFKRKKESKKKFQSDSNRFEILDFPPIEEVEVK